MSSQGPVGRGSDGPVRRRPSSGARTRVVDLGLALDRGAAASLADQLERLLRERIGRGALRPGSALPSSRALAGELEVSRGVVVEAYDRLQRQGLLTAKPGAAVKVAGDLQPHHELETSGAAAGPSAPAPLVRLHPALLPPSTFDRRAWGAAGRRALAAATDDDLRAVLPSGLPQLREAVAEQIQRSRGVACTAQDVLITSGTTHTLHALTPMLRARGPLAVESPGFMIHHGALASAGVELRPIPVSAAGLDLAALRASDATSVLVTAAHQMPLGHPMPAENRAALLAWARERDALVLEDDYDGELRYDRMSVRALQALDPSRVIYLGTTSKVLSPAVRVGWIVSPPALRDQIAAYAALAGGAPGNVTQLALTELMTRGEFDRGVSRLRRRLAAQRAALIDALARAAPQLEPLGVPAGLMLPLRSTSGDANSLMAAAAAAGIELVALDLPRGGAVLLAGFGDIHESRADAVANLIARVAYATATPISEPTA